MKFRRKAALIEARQFTGAFDPELVLHWMGLPDTAYVAKAGDHPKLAIPSALGVLDALPGDWIIKGEDGQFYPCKPEAFAANYEPAEER